MSLAALATGLTAQIRTARCRATAVGRPFGSRRSRPREMPAKSDTAKRIIVYGLDLDRVFPGDILLTRARFRIRDRSTFESKAIRLGTRGKFSHAALCIAYGQFIEAIGWGVCRLAFMQTGAREKENIQLLRLKSEVPNAQRIAQLAAKFGHEYLTRGYSVRGALGVKIRPLRDATRDEMFCSQLVARAYHQAGLPLVPAKSPERTAPGHLVKSPYLRDVTSLAVIAIHTDIPPDFYLDDGSTPQRPHQWEIVAKQKILASTKVQAALHALKAKPSSFYELECLFRDPDENRKSTLKDLDGAIREALGNARFAETYLDKISAALDRDIVETAVRGVLDRARSGKMADEELVEQIRYSRQIATQLRNDLQDRKVEYDNYKRRALRDGFRTLDYLGELQGKLVSLSRQALDPTKTELDTLQRVAADRGLDVSML